MINVFVRGSDPLPRLPPAAALFLHVDSVLEQAAGPPLLSLLLALRGRFQGAVAIVTTHRLSTVDRLFAPVLLAGAGKSGAELRTRFNHGVEDGGSLPEALQRLMQQPPFQGRVPVMVGDDQADSSALLAAEQLGGLAVRLCAPAQELPDLFARRWLRDADLPKRGKRARPRSPIPPSLLGVPVRPGRLTV